MREYYNESPPTTREVRFEIPHGGNKQNYKQNPSNGDTRPVSPRRTAVRCRPQPVAETRPITPRRNDEFLPRGPMREGDHSVRRDPSPRDFRPSSPSRGYVHRAHSPPRAHPSPPRKHDYRKQTSAPINDGRMPTPSRRNANPDMRPPHPANYRKQVPLKIPTFRPPGYDCNSEGSSHRSHCSTPSKARDRTPRKAPFVDRHQFRPNPYESASIVQNALVYPLKKKQPPRDVGKPSGAGVSSAMEQEQPWDSPMWYKGFGIARLQNFPTSPRLYEIYLILTFGVACAVHCCVLYTVIMCPGRLPAGKDRKVARCNDTLVGTELSAARLSALSHHVCTFSTWGAVLCKAFLLTALYAHRNADTHAKQAYRPLVLRLISLLLFLSVAVLWCIIPVGLTFIQEQFVHHLKEAYADLVSGEFQDAISGAGELGMYLGIACMMLPLLFFTAIPLYASDIYHFSSLVLMYWLTNILYSLNVQEPLYPTMYWHEPSKVADTTQKTGAIVATCFLVFVLVGSIRFLTGSFVFGTSMPLTISGNSVERFYVYFVD